MKEFDFKKDILIKAEIAHNMKKCDGKAAKMLCAYKYLNILPDNKEKELYVEAIKQNLSETDFYRVLSETSYSHFDNTSFWVDSIMETLENNFMMMPTSFHDILRASFLVFIEEFVSELSKKAAIELIDKVLETEFLESLHQVAFYEKNVYLKNDVERKDKTDDEKYLDLLDLGFDVFGLMYYANDCDDEEKRKIAISQRIQKQKEKKYAKQITSQLSFQHLLESEK